MAHSGMHMHEVGDKLRSVAAVKASSKGIWIYTWLFFVIVVGFALVALTWQANVAEWYTILVGVVFGVLAIVGLWMMFRYHRMVGRLWC